MQFCSTEYALVMASLLLVQVGEIRFQELALTSALCYWEYSAEVD